MSLDGAGVYPHPAENKPKPPRAQNKHFIKYTVHAPVVWPRNICSRVWFYGKIAIWPIVGIVLAKRDSKDHKKGTPIMKPATVNREGYKKPMIEQVIPAIKVRMPKPPGHTIFVQQDGTKQHTGKGVMASIQYAVGDITLETQPAKSPDLNVNYLGFFRSIQQLKEDVGVANGEELVEATVEAFDVYPRETLEQVWQSLSAVYGVVMGFKGNNSYKISHLGNEKLARAGNLPKHVRVD
ncbi:unnamed protein product, partial [Discosporangium mesarthrocarpum]